MQQLTTPTNRGADTSLLETQTEGEQGILCLKRADMDHFLKRMRLCKAAALKAAALH
jgi:hypothetical protein